MVKYIIIFYYLLFKNHVKLRISFHLTNIIIFTFKLLVLKQLKKFFLQFINKRLFLLILK